MLRSGMESDDEDFGQKLPPLSKAISDILKRYPDGQIFKELIQNADDAKAKTVHFYVDDRQHPKDNLLHHKLAKFQGPSLISFNDAAFSEEDWEGIQRLQDSVKADDPFKVGQFGIGFNSVYHVTDLPTIISGDRMAFFEPQMKIWRNSGKLCRLSILRKNFPSHLEPFSGIAGFSMQTNSSYPNTLFRFPLRTQTSDLSTKSYSVAKILMLLDTLKAEAKYLLLFLRSVESIEVYNIDHMGLRSLVFKVEIARIEQSGLRDKRATFNSDLRKLYKRQQRYGITQCLHYTANFTVKITGDHVKTSSRWLVSNVTGSSEPEVAAIAEEVHVFPTVGTALELDCEVISGGRLFCFLPLPSEACTDLPIHINGSFSLNDDRRSLKWPGKERKCDSSADWNVLLVKKVLPICYDYLLNEALLVLRNDSNSFYRALPDVQMMRGSNWEELLYPLYSSLFKRACFYTVSGEWVTIHDATFIPEDNGSICNSMQVIVQEVMEACGYQLVDISRSLRCAIKYVGLSTSLQVLSPSLVRQALEEDMRQLYTELSTPEKLELLGYCLFDEQFSELPGLQLLPLGNGGFDCFQHGGFIPQIYVCTTSCSINLLPNAEDILVNIPENPTLHKKLERVATSRKTQLKILDPNSVAMLVARKCFPDEWSLRSEVSVSETTFPTSWFKVFWDWIQHHSLSLFNGLHVVPVVSNMDDFRASKLRPSCGVVYLERNQDFPIYIHHVLTKFNVRCTLQKCVPYLRHKDLNKYLNPFTPEGVLQAISEANHDITSVREAVISPDEARAFQNFISSVLSPDAEVIESLPIFQTVCSTRPVSIKSSNHNKKVILEPCGASISPGKLPSNFILLSRTNNNQSLVHFSRKVHCPQSLVKFLQKFIFPLVRDGTFHPTSRITPLMTEVFDVFLALKTQSLNFVHDIMSLPFLQCNKKSEVLKCPSDLYDPSQENLKSLFASEAVFPIDPFNKESYLLHLRACGLKVSVNAQDLYDILVKVSGSQGLQKVDPVRLCRAKAVFQYINLNYEILSDKITASDFVDLDQGICELAHNRSILPVVCTRPFNYPRSLSWKGSSCISHVTTMNSSVLPVSSHNIETLSNIVGSEVYIFECPSSLCSILRHNPPLCEVVAHFMKLIMSMKDIENAEMDTLVMQTYEYLQKHLDLLKSLCGNLSVDLHKSHWIWLQKLHKFVSPTEVTFSNHQTFSHSLSPYIHLLPEKYSSFEPLMTYFGAHKRITDGLVVSVLQMIKSNVSPNELMWSQVKNILNWVTENGCAHAKLKTRLEDLLVPVENKSAFPQLERVKDVVFTDLEYLKNFSQSRGESFKFLHRNVQHLAKFLGVIPLSKILNISEDVFEDVGQSETLVKRLKNILRDYKDGLTIIKELLQNADDAEASEVNICYDTRMHTNDKKTLIFPGMSRAHGPALFVHNNTTFSDDDFANIQKLAGATKQDQPLKIGKFGVGFCSVYHITDVPSFISREFLYIFDPTIGFLKEEISNPLKPGKKLRFTDEIVQYTNQMNPYKGLFGFEASKAYQGTMFRFPFRDQPSDISNICYGHADVKNLIQDVRRAGSDLLLFMKNLKSISFSIKKRHDEPPYQILKISKSVIHRFPLRDERSCTKMLSIRVDMKTEQQVAVTEHKQIWLVAEDKKHSFHQVSAVACKMKRSEKLYCPETVTGEVFCFLPLHLKTGLQVHISANFAVMNDRRGIHYSDSNCKSEESQFNLDLMKNSIPQSYLTLLLTLRDMVIQSKVSERDYHFYCLWPLESALKIKNPWEHLLPQLYDLITHQELCYSRCLHQWKCVADTTILCSDILQTEQSGDMLKVIESLKYPLIDLPDPYHSFFVDLKAINEKEFLTIFFFNIQKFSVETRNNVLLSLLKTYAIRPTPCLTDLINANSCVPCTPDGVILKKCNEAVDPESKLASLYEPEDSVFPVKVFQDHLVRITLLKLGVVSNKLPWNMIIERARTVKEIYILRKKRAMERTKLLLSCIQDQVDLQATLSHEASSLKEIPFLPVLQKPGNYPDELNWAGNGKTLLCSSELLMESHSRKNGLLFGSQKVIVSQEQPHDGGCGKIFSSVASVLGILSSPCVGDVLAHLIHISKTYSLSPVNCKWIDSACRGIYKYFEERLRQSPGECNFMTVFHAQHKLLWSGDEFIHLNGIATSWNHNGPYLYSMPYLLKNDCNTFVKILDLKVRFDVDQLLEVLSGIHGEFGENPLCKRETKVVVSISEAIAENLGELSLDSKLECYLHDENYCMQSVKNLVWNDAPWCKLKVQFPFVSSDISRPIALKMGVQLVRSRAFDQYDTSGDHFDGVPFGQHENLTQRILNILESYTCDETVLKELLQNADDAQATKLYFILDERKHGTQRIPSTEWKDLQGPALLIWNDKGFSEEDLVGIQKLGLGSKRTKAESIGQYGVGFNVVYHLTDCPSLFTNGHTLCIFDPHCRYVPGASEVKPGRRLDQVDEKFWENMSDLKGAYLRDKIDGCPSEIQRGGSLFRFPLRSTPELIKKSRLIDEESKLNMQPLSSWKFKLQLKEWAPKLKKALLFLKHVTELRFCVIEDTNDGPKLTTTHHFKAGLDSEGLQNRCMLHKKVQNFQDQQNNIPFVISYSLKLIEEAPMQEVESWLIQQGVGDVNNHSQHWEFLSHIKPMHGLAAQISGSSFTPSIFCFLPLPLHSQLPVHVNANFILDSSSRSTLWQSRDIETADDKKKWNDRLIEALASSYAIFLVNCKVHFLKKESYSKSSRVDLKHGIDCYYKLYPKWLSPSHASVGEMMDLAKHVYRILARQKCSVLVVISKIMPDANPRLTSTSKSIGQKYIYSAKWQPVLSEEHAEQVYFWEESQRLSAIPPILKCLGMKLTAAPMWIKEHFDAVEVNVPEATPESVFGYYKLHYHQVNSTGIFPCPVSDTTFREAVSVKKLIGYIVVHKKCVKEVIFEDDVEETENMNDIDVAMFIKPPYNLPLLLTADGCIRLFDSNEKVIMSKYFEIFPNMLDKFLHPILLPVGLDQDYFLKPLSANWNLIYEILENTLHDSLKGVQRVQNASSIISEETLEKLWQCFTFEKNFSKHLVKIVQTWALILSDRNELYQYNSNHEHLMPLAPPPTVLCSESLELQVFKILTSNGMPKVHSLVLKSKDWCPTFTDHKSILRNLCYLHEEKKLASILSDENIEYLFSYFSEINFQHDHESLTLVKSLSLFKNIDGRYCNLLNEAYFWPEDISMAGIKNYMPQLSLVFLKSDGAWQILTNGDTLGIKAIHRLTFYVRFIFPYFGMLTDDERLLQLSYIKDKMFATAKEFSKMENDRKLQLMGSSFISALKELPVFRKNGKLEPISQFSDSEHPLFKLLPSFYTFPPKNLCTTSWLQFFMEIGLQTVPTKKEYINFCTGISDYKEVKHLRKLLLACLFQTLEWHDDGDFLDKVSRICFVTPNTVEKLSWIVPPSNNKHGQTHSAFVCLRGCASYECAELVWTVCPVVKLPSMHHPPFTYHKEKEERKLSFFSHLGILLEPRESLVIQNVINLSKSRFSNFKLFECYSQDCVKKESCTGLFETVKQNLAYLNKKNSSICSSLVDVPCIPVSNDASNSDLSKPVLVCPLQVIVCQSNFSLHPFLSSLPTELYGMLEMLQKMKVNSELHVDNILYALSLIHCHVEIPLDVNTVESVKCLLKSFYHQLSNEFTEIKDNSVLYLPDLDRSLRESTKLIYDDKGYYKNETFDFHAVPEYSIFSLLCHKKEENNEYDFNLKSFVSKLPKSLRPLPFSQCVRSQLESRCQPQLENSKFAQHLENAFRLDQFAEVAEIVLKHVACRDSNACEKFVACLKACVASLNIVTISALTADIMFTHTCPPTKIGTASMDYLLHESDDSEFTLYIHSGANLMQYNLLESLSECFASTVIKKTDLELSLFTNPERCFITLLRAGSLDDLRMIMNDMGIKTSNIQLERKFDYSLKPKLGEPIPEEWHHRLFADVYNSFRPQELVGYEVREGFFIFARIEHKVNQATEFCIESDEEKKLDEYVIRIKETDEAEENEKKVPVIDLHKILRIKEPNHVDDSMELELYDPESINAMRFLESSNDLNLKDIYIAICKELRRISKISDEDLKRKCLKATYLKWHPDKNDHPLATKAFQFLQRQIDRMKKGLDLEDPDLMEETGFESSGFESSEFNNEWFKQWDDISHQRRSFYRQEQKNFRTSSGRRSKGADENLDSHINISPDHQKAQVWIEQAVYDVRAMECMHREAVMDEKLCNHVCFMAHQVAEKSLKAGMFAKNGLHPDSLRYHDLDKHARALEQVDRAMLGLGIRANLLQSHDYYYKTRYPYRYGSSHQVPSNKHSPAEAAEAVKIAKEIYDIVKNAM